ncbi:MAG: class I SAM-dependent methyltransferase [Nanoarchaeota archaeon]
MEELRDRIFTNLAQINELAQKITSKVKEDKANIWDETLNIIRITNLLYNSINMDRGRFRQYLEKIGALISILKADENFQKREIENWGIEEWFERFEYLMKEFADFIFNGYLYYFTCDTFSENSRDNQKKAESITRLTHRNANLLEIGCGTAPIMRRLIRMGYNVISIEFDPAMIQEALVRCPEARGKIIRANFFEYDLGNNTFDLIFIESGLFMFTILGRNKLIFELFAIVTNEFLEHGLNKVFNALKKGGLFLIGTQRLMKKVKINDNLYFAMKRKQETDRAIRELTYYRKKGIFSKREILYTIKQEKPTLPYERFVTLANSIGFTGISISEDNQWVILRK